MIQFLFFLLPSLVIVLRVEATKVEFDEIELWRLLADGFDLARLGAVDPVRPRQEVYLAVKLKRRQLGAPQLK